MAYQSPRVIVATVDRQLVFWLVLLAIGIGGFTLAFLGEFVFGWWRDLGPWLAWGTGALTIIAAVGAAGRFQLRAVASDVKDIKMNTGAIPRIEANTEGIPRIEASMAEAVGLLREIRDRLPRG